MRIEMLPGMDNVIRFPVEERAHPTLSLVREVAPDCREVFRVVESFGIEAPAYDLRHQVDRETAERILNAVPAEPGEVRTAMLDAMLAPLVKTAVQACRAANEASHVMVAAQQRLQAAVTSGSPWAEQLRERADQLCGTAAELLVGAHARCEVAEGAARAIGIAMRDEAWAPHDPREVGEWLASGGHLRR